jgi:hypothetical protein
MHTAMASRAVFRDRDKRDWSDTGDYLPHAGMPVYRVPLPSHAHRDAPEFNPVYDLENDPHQEHPIQDAALEKKLEDKLREVLERVGAPPCQFERTGL